MSLRSASTLPREWAAPFLEALPFAVALFSPGDARLVWVNRAWVGTIDMGEFLAPSNAEALAKLVRRTATTCATQTITVTLRRRGQPTWCRLQATMPPAEGCVMVTVGETAAPQDAGDSFYPADMRSIDSTLWQARAGLWRIDNGRMELSPSLCALIGEPDGVASLAAWYRRVHPDDLPAVKAVHRAVRDWRQDSFALTYRVRHAMGHYIALSSRARAERDGDGSLRVAGLELDITETEALRHSLEFNRQRFDDYTAAASDWYWETDAEHRFAYLPRLQQRDMGFDVGNFVGRTRLEVTGADPTAPEWRRHLATLGNHRPFRDFTYTMTDRHGHTRHIQISGKPVYDRDGRFAGYRGVGSDVTERVLQDALLREGHRLQMLGTLAASAAHEFNNLLVPILGFADILAGKLTAPDLMSHLDGIRMAAEQAAALVDNILQFSRRQLDNRIAADVNDGVRDGITLVGLDLPTRVSLTADYHDGPLPVRVARGLIPQIVLNLVRNARDAIGEDGEGHIVVRTRRRLSPVAGSVRGHAVIEIQDDGPGMAPQVLARVKEPFFTTKAPGKGTGLGLAILDSLIREHGGSLRIDSHLGQGTLVRVELPLAGDQHAATAADLRQR